MVTTHFDLVSDPFWVHRDPKRAHLAPKRPFWGPLRYSEGNGLPEGANIRSKCVVNMSPTQADQSGAVGTKFGLPGPSEGPKRGILGQNGPF